MVDKVRPLKLETPARGTQDDDFPTEVDASEDYVELRGIVVQNNTSSDEAVILTRDSDSPDNMTFKDEVITTPVKLQEFVTDTTHRALRHLIHFIEEGPTDGFASGAYREVTGAVFPTAIIWWESSSKLKKLVERNITWTGASPTTDQWKIYDTDGSTALVTVSDAISYSGPFETNRTRTITVH